MTSFAIEGVRRRLPGRQIEWFETIGSTMHEAARLAGVGCASGTAVIADEQTAGQGRHGHSWHSEAGAGLYVSVVLQLALPPNSLPALTLALGLAAAEAIDRVSGLDVDLRWPNDVMIDDRKVAGILVQLTDPAAGVAIAGIGVNVNHTQFPDELGAEVTSLSVAAGATQSREDLLIALLPAIDSFIKMLVEGGSQPVLNMFTSRSSYARGRRVRVEQPTGVLEGVTAGLDPSGFLILRSDDGSESLILAGGVRPV
jgi:BirA family biotin operon repressor/biotin-[acetyl-CoA-carboxylase] ligase